MWPCFEKIRFGNTLAYFGVSGPGRLVTILNLIELQFLIKLLHLSKTIAENKLEF
jgi:hypothetical protein